jgi:hypothetical protein
MQLLINDDGGNDQSSGNKKLEDYQAAAQWFFL